MKTQSLFGLLALLFACMIAQAQSATRLIGAITSVRGNTLTIKTDAGEVHSVEVPSSASLERVAPGQKDLSTAVAIEFRDLDVGDRTLIKLAPSTPGSAEDALQVIVIKQEDVAQKQKQEREDWQRRGVSGLVKNVDAESGNITLSTGVAATAKTVLVHTLPTTILKRYAPNSVSFDAAQPAPIMAIRAGDPLRARGEKNADATEIAAEEVVSGSFRSISGTIVSLDATHSSLVVKDLTTKKAVTVRILADTQLRRLAERMAQMLAIRLKSGANETSSAAKQNTLPANSDPQQMLNHAPTIQFSNLVKGEAVMVIAADGAGESAAITLLVGVAPLLEASTASQNLLSNWSMNTGASEAAAQ